MIRMSGDSYQHQRRKQIIGRRLLGEGKQLLGENRNHGEKMYSTSKNNALHRITLNSKLTFAASPRDMLPDTHRFTRARELLG